MGTVVTLPPRRPSRASARRTDDAAILLFMGVRYVRDRDDADPVPTASADARRQADRELPPLEIA